MALTSAWKCLKLGKSVTLYNLLELSDDVDLAKLGFEDLITIQPNSSYRAVLKLSSYSTAEKVNLSSLAGKFKLTVSYVPEAYDRIEYVLKCKSDISEGAITPWSDKTVSNQIEFQIRG